MLATLRLLNIVLFEPGEIDTQGNVRVTGVRAAHLLGVLQVAVGQSVRIGVMDGPTGIATVQGVGQDGVDLACRLDADVATKPRIDLLLALPRPKVMKRLWAQLAAIGVRRIILTNAERVERHYFDTHVLLPGCYRPLLIEGLQQSRDTHVPLVSTHRRFKVLIEDELDALSGPGLRLVADPSAPTPITSLVSAQPELTPLRRLMIAIGPEGGWNAFEMDLLEEHGFRPVSMGPRTLRTDTACVALLALAHDALSRAV